MVVVLDYKVWYVILMLKSTKIDSLALIVMLRVINLKIKTIVSLFVKWSSYHCMLSNDLELERVWEICENASQARGVVLDFVMGGAPTLNLCIHVQEPPILWGVFTFFCWIFSTL